MTDNVLPADRPFFDFAQAAQDLLRQQLHELRAEDPETHAVLTAAPATWRVVMTLVMPTGQTLVSTDCALPSGEVVALSSVEFQRRTPS